jgi:hypothetical protein
LLTPYEVRALSNNINRLQFVAQRNTRGMQPPAANGSGEFQREVQHR